MAKGPNAPNRFFCTETAFTVCVRIYRSACLSACLSVCLSLSLCLSACPSIRPSVCPSIRPSVCPCVCASVRPSVGRVCLSYLSLYLPVYLPVCLPACLVYPSISLFQPKIQSINTYNINIHKYASTSPFHPQPAHVDQHEICRRCRSRPWLSSREARTCWPSDGQYPLKSTARYHNLKILRYFVR